MDPYRLAEQLTGPELRSLTRTSGEFAVTLDREIEQGEEAVRHSSMTPAAEAFWFGETRADRLSRLRRHAQACRATSRASARALAITAN